jgi:uncharacterized protein (DUF1501 family)
MLNRRSFLKSSLALPALTGAGTLLQTLAAMQARAVDTSGYRALVCVFLYGGMDCHDTVLPYDPASWEVYSRIRASLLASYAAQPGGSSRTREALLPLEPASGGFGRRQFALPPQFSGIHQLFGQGAAAVVGNVGPLVEPTDRDSYRSNSVALPARLFSHNDQQSTWMSFAPEGAPFGWAGRFADAVLSANAQAAFSQISLAGSPVLLTGEQVAPYMISADGVPSIRLIELAGRQLGPLLRDHFTSEGSVRDNLFERDFIDLSRVSLDSNEALDQALRSAPGLATPFPASPLGAQLSAVARTLSVRDTLEAGRQIFFVAMGGFDTHATQAADLPPLQQDIGDSLAAFYAATRELGLEDQVTTFTAADFGRTLTVNGDGTDHGWGGHHFVVGGAVRGGDIYGEIPVSELGHEQDAGNGRLIPTVAVEQFAEPLGRWYGLDQQSLNQALPGLSRFPAGGLGFL